MRTSERILAVIPARGGSKRLKNKNILKLAGKPMIAHTIRSAIDSKLFKDVLVSTDCKAIARVAKAYGAAVPFLRDPQLADDHTPVAVATAAALNQMEEFTGKRYDAVVQLMPNCPCRTAKDICAAYAQFSRSRSDFQVSVFPFGWMNPWWAMRLTSASRPVALFPEAYQRRSQDLEKLYCPTGAIWIARPESLKKEKTFYGKGYEVYVMDWQHAVDIDDEHDLDMAKILLAMSVKKKP